MADRLRIVTFSPGGRPIVQLDLADGVTYALQRDTPSWSPPTRNQEWSQSSNRYGGARLAHESHQNGGFTAQWYISGATQDVALANRDAFWDMLESIGTGRYLEYRPDGATRSSYLEIRGPAPWSDQYRWIEFSQTNPKLGIQAGFVTAPLWEGDRMLIDDPFDVNSLTDYTLAHGTLPTYSPLNLVTNPDFELNTTGWANTGAALAAGATISRVTAQHNTGVAALQLVTTITNANEGTEYALSGTFKAGVTYTASGWLKGNAGGEVTQFVFGDVAASDFSLVQNAALSSSAWTQFSVTWTPTADRTSGVVLDIRNTTAAVQTIFIDDVSVSAAGTGMLTTASTAEWDIIHTARGYSYGDAQTTLTYTTPTAATAGVAGEIGAILSWIDDNNYLMAFINTSANTLTLYKKDAGSFTALAGPTAITALTAGTKYAVAIREEGNAIFAEHWIGAPTLGTPSTTINATLTGANATKYGFGSTGKAGIHVNLTAPVGWTFNEFSVEPYTYVGRALPQVIQLGGAIPGRAPARTDIAFSMNSTPFTRSFALFGWAPRGTGPFGLQESAAATLTGLTEVSAANGHGGTYAQATVSGAGSAIATWSISRTNPAPTSLNNGGQLVEVWARLRVDPSMTGFVQAASIVLSSDGQTLTPFESPSGSRSITISTGSVFMMTRVGTFFIPAATTSATLRLAWSWTGGSGLFGVDYFFTTIADQRAASPTAKVQSGYPLFTFNTVKTKVIQSDLTGFVQYPATSPALPVSNRIDDPSPGLGGSLIEIPPGLTDVVFHADQAIPDGSDSLDAVLDSGTGVFTRIAVHPVPRYFVPRGS